MVEEGKIGKKKVEYFFDTSAIIEISEGNEIYSPYFDLFTTITIFNLAEIYWISLNKMGESNAEKLYDDYKEAVVDVTDDVLKEAMQFRKQHKDKGFSYADSIGYIFAKKNNIKFLTSDSQFKDLENVEYVK